MVYDRASGAVREVTAGFADHVEAFAWSPDSSTLYFTAGVTRPQPAVRGERCGRGRYAW